MEYDVKYIKKKLIKYYLFKAGVQIKVLIIRLLLEKQSSTFCIISLI